MSRVREVVVEADTSASPDRVWSLLSDTPSYTRWAGAKEAVVESGHGVGEERRIHTGLLTTHERVTAEEPPHHYTYEMLSGAPIRDYRSDVTLDDTPSGTHIRWDATFSPKIPGTGWLLERVVHRLIGKAATGLARTAEQGGSRA